MSVRLCKSHIFAYILLILLAIFIFKDTGTSGIINNSDTAFPLSPKEFFFRNLTAWNPFLNAGKPNYIHLNMLPVFFIRAILDFFSFPIWIINRLWFISALALLGASIYYCTGVLRINGFWARLIPSVYSMLNPLVMRRLHGGQSFLLFEEAIMVFVFSFFIAGINCKSPSKKFRYIILFLIFSVFNGIVVRVLTLILIGMYLLWIICLGKGEEVSIKSVFKFSILSGLGYVLINGFWLFPAIYQMSMEDIIRKEFKFGSDIATLLAIQPRLPLKMVYRMLMYDSPELLYEKMLSNPIGIIGSTILVCLVYSNLFLNRYNKDRLFFISASVLFTLLSTGISHPLWGRMYYWVWNNLSIFRIFRNPEKFQIVLVFIYAVLIGYVLDGLCNILKKRKLKFILFTSIIGIICVDSGSLLLGGFAKGCLIPMQVPDYYYDFKKYMIKENGRLLALPSQRWYATYKWAPSDMENILVNFLNNPIVIRMPESELSGILGWIDYAVKRRYQIPKWMFRLAFVDWILLQMDINEKQIDKLKDYLDKNLNYREKFGKLFLYKIDCGENTSPIYATRDIIYLDNTVEAVMVLDEAIPESGLDSLPVVFVDQPLHVQKEYIQRDILFQKSTYIFTKEDIKERLIREFYVPKGDYRVKVKVKLNRYPYKFISEMVRIGLSSENFQWEVRGNNVLYRSLYSKRGFFQFDIFFDGGPKEDEYIQLRYRKELDIDMGKFPCLDLSYMLEDLDIQTIEIVLGVDFDNDGSVDGHLRGIYPRYTKDGFSVFTCNMFEKVMKEFPNQDNYILKHLELYPHKIWGRDCSNEKKGKYSFWLRDVVIYRPSKQRFPLNEDGKLVIGGKFKLDNFMYKLDDTRYRFKRQISFLEKGFIEEVIVPLKSGLHLFTEIQDDRNLLEWVMIEPTGDFGDIPDIQVGRVSPTKYTVKHENANIPFWLVFGESFDPGWYAYINIDGHRKKKILEKHFVGNGYANAWFVEPGSGQNGVEIDIEYKPQRLFMLGVLSSVSTLMILLGIVFIKR